MSAQPQIPQGDTVNIEIDGVAYQARKGQMVIQVADAAGVVIPRFCYHDKLPIAANCRMCLVEVERAPKPMPACATPVTEGMKVHTRSPKALAAQRGVMEFLLINHPLDCPICDQGGECELQDLALGFGRGISRFAEKKRVVPDKNIGPLIATDLTRCIHCTRCIRFLDVIAGQKELGATGRGEHMKIGTYVEHAIESEMSGNVIDVCPVGALTSKPFRFTARAWELEQHPTVAPHDAIGSNLYVHTRRGRAMRVVPRENEAINEVWLSDRDRFSYQGLYADDRLQSPMVRDKGVWRQVSWELALEIAAAGLRKVAGAHGADQVGALASPIATLEELYLLQKLMRGIGSANVDHRLRRADFSDQERDPVYPWLGQSIAELEQVDAALLIGSNVRKEQPIAAHRLRKASRRGARIMFVNPRAFDFHFPVHESIVVAPHAMIAELAGIARAVCELGRTPLPSGLEGLAGAGAPTDAQRTIAQRLKDAGNATVLLGSQAQMSPYLSVVRALAAVIAERAGARLGYLPMAGNSVGAWLAGAVPHRLPGGNPAEKAGFDARAMIADPRKAVVLLGVEPEFDCFDAAGAAAAMGAAEFVVALTPFASERMKEYAHVLLPIAPFTETSGTYVNAEGCWQSFGGVAAPVGETRPGWKVLRVLGNLLDCAGFEYNSSEQVREEVRAVCAGMGAGNRVDWKGAPKSTPPGEGLTRVADVAIYGADAIVRRAPALQATPDAHAAETVRINRAEARRLGLEDAQQVSARQGGARVTLALALDDGIPDGCVWICAGTAAGARLGPAIGPVDLERA